jgi:hypothetical protein
MAPHWKCGSGQPVAGSNPALSATYACPGRATATAQTAGPRIHMRCALSGYEARTPDRFSAGARSARTGTRIAGKAAHATLAGSAKPPQSRLEMRGSPAQRSPGENLSAAMVPSSRNGHRARIRQQPTAGLVPAQTGAVATTVRTPAVATTVRTPRPEPIAKASLLSFRSRARRGTSGALYLQSAPAGLNSHPRSPYSNATASSDVEDRVPRSGDSRTVSGPEGSSTKRTSSGAAERPGPSRSSRRARDHGDRRRVHGTSSFSASHHSTVAPGAQ